MRIEVLFLQVAMSSVFYIMSLSLSSGCIVSTVVVDLV